MGRIVLQRLIWAFFTILGITAITFFLMNLVPGGPFAAVEGGRALPEEIVRQIERQYGLDRPLVEQYVRYIGRLAQGDLGHSLQSFQPVSEMLGDRLPVSMTLGVSALSIGIVVGVPLGIASALWKFSWVDRVVTGFSILSIATPSFVVGLLLIIFISLNVGWVPVAGWGTPQHALMPVIALSLLPIALLARYTRSAMLEVLSEAYVTVARSKGLGERTVILNHALRNALISVVTVFGLIVPQLLVGSFLVETVFAIPGTGRMFVTALVQRDYPVIMTMAILFGVFVTMINIIVDLTYLYLDPRIRY